MTLEQISHIVTFNILFFYGYIQIDNIFEID